MESETLSCQIFIIRRGQKKLYKIRVLLSQAKMKAVEEKLEAI